MKCPTCQRELQLLFTSSYCDWGVKVDDDFKRYIVADESWDGDEYKEKCKKAAMLLMENPGLKITKKLNLKLGLERGE